MQVQRGFQSKGTMEDMIAKRCHQRAILFCLWKNGKTATEAIAFMQKALKDLSFKRTTIFEVFAQFEIGNFQLFDKPRPGRKSYVSKNGSIVPFLKSKIEEDRHISVSKLKSKLYVHNGLDLDHQTLRTIIENSLGLSRRVACWTPHILTPENKKARKKWANQTLRKFYKFNKPMQNLNWFITCDEIWCYEDPVGHRGMKAFMEKKESFVSDKKIAPTNMTKKKSMFLIFFSKFQVELIEQLPRGSKANGEWFKSALKRLYSNYRQRQSLITQKKKGSGKSLIQHFDNAPSHRSALIKNWIKDKANESLIQWPQPPYSPDMAPSDFYFFRNFSKWMKEKEFKGEEDLRNQVEEYFYTKKKKILSILVIVLMTLGIGGLNVVLITKEITLEKVTNKISMQ